MWGRGVLPTALPAPFSATLSPAFSVYLHECGATGSSSGQTSYPFCPTLCQSRSRHCNASPLHSGCPSPPLLLVWMNVYFLFPWCQTSLPFDFLSILVVRGGAVCLPTPPSCFFPVVSFSYHVPSWGTSLNMVESHRCTFHTYIFNYMLLALLMVLEFNDTHFSYDWAPKYLSLIHI